jgi:bifunctional non-homologous end joining protein LigD
VRTFPALLLAKEIPGTKPAHFPNYVEPLLATLHDKPPPGDAWVHEIKWDGYRVQLHVRNGTVRLYTRRGHDWTERLATIAEAAWHLQTYAAAIDGEVIVPGPDGRADFKELERDLGAGRMGRLVFYAFDLLHLDGLDLRDATLMDRKAVLAELLADAHAPIRLSEHLEIDGAAMYRHACEHGLEGIVSKRRDGKYRSGRGDAWRKVTCRARDTFVVAGYALKNGRFDGLYLGRAEDGRLVYAGKVENGFSAEDTDALRAAFARIETRRAPITAGRKFPKARWVKPQILVDVEHRGTVQEGLRHPSFKGVRRDLMDAAALTAKARVRLRDARGAGKEDRQ